MPPVKFKGTKANAKRIPTDQGFRLASAETNRARKYKVKRKKLKKRASLRRPWDIGVRRGQRGTRNNDGSVTFTI